MGYTSEWKPIVMTGLVCRKCKGPHLEYRDWESSDGAYEDQQFKCLDCGYSFWVEGIDS